MTNKILFIGGTLNQITQLHQISKELPEYKHYFSAQYCDGLLGVVQRWGWLDFTAPGRPWVARVNKYIHDNQLTEDQRGKSGNYDLVLISTDLILPKNIRHSKVILVQEGMTDPENFAFHLVRAFPFLPRWFASSSTNGLSNAYDYFCVASSGYRDLFIRKGVAREKLVVTGIPNFDDCRKYLNNDFPYRGYVLVCTSDSRETYKIDRRSRFLKRAFKLANGKPMIFKLHPNENAARAREEIKKHVPGALVFEDGRAEEMVANCDVLITQYSTLAYVGLALGKPVHSYFDVDELKRLLPHRHGQAARNIARVCRFALESEALHCSLDSLEFAS